jgi:hypothetical protein
MSNERQFQSEDYLRRIDQAVAQSKPLQDWLIWRSSQDGEVLSKRMLLLIESLKGQVAAKRWLQDPLLAPYLPMVLRASALRESSDLKSFGVLEPWYRLLLKEPAGVVGMVSRFYYPLSIALASMLLFYFLAVSIVPTFKAMFDDFELRLPSLTKWFLQTSDFIAYQPVSLLASLFSGILAVYGLVKLYSYLMDRFEGSSFISFYRRGTKTSLGSMARWTGTMAELLAIGAPAAQAVATAGIASQRPYLNLQSQRLSKTFEANPKSTWRAQGGSTSFAGSSIAALEMHQQGTDTTGVLRELAQSYAERWNCRANLSYDWLGPIILLFVAKFVFFLVLALFLPLISLITSLSG